MPEKKMTSAVITAVSKMGEDICGMWIKEKEMAAKARAGQFVSLYCQDGSRLLPRPISICEIDRENGLLRFVYRIVGKGTEEFSRKGPGDRITAAGPLGNGFTLENKESLLIGGGIGIPPMLQLAKELSGKGISCRIVLGYRDSLFLQEEFNPFGQVFLSTEDGSAGTKGTVMDAILANGIRAEQIYACGPLAMLRGVKAYARENAIQAQISMEERMACGIGACLACVCSTKDVDSHTHVKNTRVCKDGPVFDAFQIEL